MIIKEKMLKSSTKQAISELPKLSLSKRSKCNPFLVKMSFICVRIKNHFHISSFTLSHVLKQRHKETRKWPLL